METFESNCSSYTVHRPFGRQRSWHESSYLCSLNNGHLVSIEDEKELNFLAEELQPKRYSGIEYFIGLRQRSGKWTWISNNSIEVAPYRFPWGSVRKPDGDGECAKMYFTGYGNKHLVFDDIHCYGYTSKSVGYICEKHVCCHKKKGMRGKITPQDSRKKNLDSKTAVMLLNPKFEFHVIFFYFHDNLGKLKSCNIFSRN